jgi:gliding motility-associated-like protein
MSNKRLFLSLLVALMPLLAFCQEEVEDSVVVIGSESKLVFPNAFSPNGDGHNDVYKAKTCQNIEEFHAYIFNRWGQKLFEWTDPDKGWDGTSNGRDVADGVYFVLVKARGADGRTYNIRKDVNLLRGYDQNETTRR